MNNQPGEYQVDSDSVIAMKQAGVSDRIISVVVAKNSAQPVLSAPPNVSVPATIAPMPPVRDPGSSQRMSQPPRNADLQRAARTGKPRVFLGAASSGTNWSAVRSQSMEMSKDLERDCPGVMVTINQPAADYTILLNHIELGLIIRDNQFEVA